MSEIEDYLCFDSEGLGLNEASINVEFVQNLANNSRSETQIDIDLESDELSVREDVVQSFSQNEINIESNDSQYSDSNEGKRRKIKRKRISKKYKKGNKITVEMRVNEYKEPFIVKNNNMYCNLCHDFVDFKHKNVIDFHLNSKKHLKNLENKSKQPSIAKSFGKQNEKEVYLEELVYMMTANNIPLEKANNENFKNFFSKYCQFGNQIK
jgi:hypothetical protein